MSDPFVIVDIAHIKGETYTGRLSVSIAPGKKEGQFIIEILNLT